MSRQFVKKAFLIIGVTLVLLVAVLGIHIYIVTKPKADNTTVAMARIDIKQNIDEQEAGAMEKWLGEQTGVQHVVLNRSTNIIIFTFYPVRASANAIADNLKATFHVNAERFVPTAAQMAGSCPAMTHSFTGKIYSFFLNIFNHQ